MQTKNTSIIKFTLFGSPVNFLLKISERIDSITSGKTFNIWNNENCVRNKDNGHILIFDKSSKDSFDHVAGWYVLLDKRLNRVYKGTGYIPQKIVALIGIITNSERINREQGQGLADDLEIPYFEAKATDRKAFMGIYQTLTRMRSEKAP